MSACQSEPSNHRSTLPHRVHSGGIQAPAVEPGILDPRDLQAGASTTVTSDCPAATACAEVSTDQARVRV